MLDSINTSRRHEIYKNNNDNKCFTLNTIHHYKKRRREKSTMTHENITNNNNNDHHAMMENVQCFLCRRKIQLIESNVHENFSNNNNKSLNVCTECRQDTSSFDVNDNDKNNIKSCKNRNQPPNYHQHHSDNTTTSYHAENDQNKRIFGEKENINYDKRKNLNKQKSMKKLLTLSEKNYENSSLLSINNTRKYYSKIYSSLICSTKKLLLVLLLLNSFSMFSLVNAQLVPLSDTKEPGLCPSTDIRNSPDGLARLENCTVIEGFLQILMIDDKHDASKYENYSFPNLVEVTDYIIIYRVNGLLTLRKLFPNLKVIRGNNLFNNHALVLYENMKMEEIGLYSLSRIIQGSVRISNNPNLCYVDTINWGLITNESFVDSNVFDGNKQKNACPVCPRHPENSSVECPRTKGSTGRDSFLCWTADHCQKVCPAACPGNCFNSTTCCDKDCVGGCTGLSSSDCIICRKMMRFVNGKKICLENCTSGLYAYSSRSCITEEACRNLPVPIQVKREDIKFPFVPRADGICDRECPSGYFPDTSHCTPEHSPEDCRKKCKKCKNNKCEKICKGATVDSISTAQHLRGCTKIDGNLEITIKSRGGQNVVRELQALSAIEEITESLRIVRSNPIVSLHFFKELKVIGTKLQEQDKALYITDNQNLQELFNTSVRIVNGTMAFHYNPKLCVKFILDLKKKQRGIKIDSEESMKISNGDKISCNTTKINASVQFVRNNAAMIRWDKFQIDDPRSLLGYTLSYIEAPFQNVSVNEGRDACDRDGWIVDDVHADDQVSIITKLKPYTQYACYVKTFMISSEDSGGESDIFYFKTLADEPKPVQHLEATSNASSEIVVSFKPPKTFNGEPDKYEIVVNLTDNKDVLNHRDFCNEPPKPDENLSRGVLIPDRPEENKKDTCDCQNIVCETSSKGVHKEDDAVEAISFEDKLQDWVFIKYKDVKSSNRKRRDVSYPFESPFSTTIANLVRNARNVNAELQDEDPLVDDNGKLVYQKFYTTDTKVVLKNLKHYSGYHVSVRACRKPEDAKILPPGVKQAARCSSERYTQAVTQMVPGADDVVTVSTVQEHNMTGAFKVIWEPPKHPNGLIVSYSIRYSLPGKQFKPVCLTAVDFKKTGYLLVDELEPGNYSVEVMATSMFGDGAYSSPRFQIIPEKPNTLKYIIAILVVCLLLVIGVVVVYVWYYKRRFPAQMANMKLIASVNPEYMSMQYTPDEWELPREKIIQLQELGQGSFGMVYEGIIKDKNGMGDEQKCAIKTVNESATDRERINFLKEASVMKGFDTHHVVKLLGVCSIGQPILVVMELMGNGDLKGYLRSHRPDRDSLDGVAPQPPSLRRTCQMAIEIADGMAYLAFKKFVHRDLAARNCMVAEDLTVKIGDFGMTRDIYETDYYRKGSKGLLPVRWMAPESLKDGVFTNSSDVFSYGVVLWEMATLASQPYQGLSNDQVLRYVIDGGVMERPENCPDKFYELMRRCWTHRPSARPTFMQIVQELHDDADKSFREVSFFDSPSGQRYLHEKQIENQPTDDATTPLTRPEDDVESSIDDDLYLVNRTNSQHLSNRDITLQAMRTSQPLR
ncbi:insulin-like receptor isoform X2 [Culicoides brevitarsis]|uniref:insulin-like receptor isoform X2 n=1 Tax=Culicoides brevitarsis TaxID=469753 RepID=UPI00307B9ABB